MRIKTLCKMAYDDSKRAGRYDNPSTHGEKIALMHSELSEALEVIRMVDKDGLFPPSEKIPEFDGVEEEMADVVIRVADFCGHLGLNLEDAISAKMAYNRTRSHKHGGKKF